MERRVLPRAQTLEAKLVLVVSERAGNVRGEEQRRDLTDHGVSLHLRLLMRRAHPTPPKML